MTAVKTGESVILGVNCVSRSVLIYNLKQQVLKKKYKNLYFVGVFLQVLNFRVLGNKLNHKSIKSDLQAGLLETLTWLLVQLLGHGTF